MPLPTRKKDKFLEMLLTIALNVQESADYLANFKINNEKDLREFSRVMKEYENKGDDYNHDIIVALNRTFITPLEREDILDFAMKLDDVLDGLEQWASRMEIYNITSADEFMVKFVDKLFPATQEIAKAAELLTRKRFNEIRSIAIKINEIESDCDEILQESIRTLFSNETNPITIIQYKELYEMLEAVADSCEDVANALESIIMRNV